MDKKRTLMGNLVQVVFRLPPDLDEKIRAIADEEQRSYSSVLRQAVNDWVKSRGKRRKA